MFTVSAMTRRALNRATLARQGLLERRRLSPARLAEQLCGLQAQEVLPPLVGLWTRLEGVERARLEALLREGELVRASLMRGTLHLVSAADYKRVRPAMAPVLESIVAGHAYTKDLDVDAVAGAARKILGTRAMTFAQLREELAKAFPDANERGLGYATKMGLPLTIDPDGGYRIADVGPAISRPKLVERYLGAFGPATPADMQTWSGLRGLAADFAKARVIQEGKLFDLEDAPRPDPDTPAPVRFVPAFDNLVLAHADRSRVIDAEHQGKVTTKNLRVNPTFLVDGFVAGTWRAEVKGKRAMLALEPFGRLKKKTRTELEAEGEALLRFLAPEASALAVT